MPRVRRARTIAATPEELWRVVSDPYHLPRWWPRIERVEEASEEAWTQVLRSPAGRAVRVDFTRVEYEPPRRLVWRQEIEESPFERILDESTTEISLAEAAHGGTRVELRAVQRLHGLSRLGAPMVRRATRRQLDEALEGLARAAGQP